MYMERKIAEDILNELNYEDEKMELVQNVFSIIGEA